MENIKGNCERCGACCRSNPPTLHKEDIHLYKEGVLKKKDLITYRKGEIIYDNVKDILLPLEQEIIKVRSKPNKRACLFFDEQNNACSIYDLRPLECRMFYCNDIKSFIENYSKTRITRLDLISNKSALGKIIEEHEKRCSVSIFLKYIEEFKKTRKKEVLKEISNMIDQNDFFREYLTEAGAIKEELNFVFGRRLYELAPLEVVSLLGG